MGLESSESGEESSVGVIRRTLKATIKEIEKGFKSTGVGFHVDVRFSGRVDFLELFEVELREI